LQIFNLFIKYSLTKYDKQRRTEFLVGTANVEEYAPGKWQYAERENGDIDADVYDIAKDFLE
jgi:hypothetical protein